MKKRIIATVLSLALIITQVPWAALDVFAASQEQVKSSIEASEGATYVSDNDTFESWRTEFSAENTEFAGAIWTDKSVFESDELDTDFGKLKLVEFDGIDANGNIKMKTETDTKVSAESDNFVVAMSALGSTKEITGYSALPSDTVFVLDVSNSMSNNDLAKMVEATNKAIDRLQNLNRHNRVAVVVYGYDGAVLLDIDRYATTKTAVSGSDVYPVYIELDNSYSQIRTARSRKTSTGGTVNINSIDFDKIVNDMPKWDYSSNYGRYLDDVASYLEKDDVLGTARIGVDINWSRAVEDKSNYQTWQTFLRNRVQQAVNNQQGQQQNRETSDLTDSDGNYVTASVTASGATYIQGGMYAAERLFNDIYTANDTAIETGLIQGGTARLPITVLMSDGAPTYGATDYTQATVDNRVLGNGGSDSVSDYLVFPAQLTAAHLSKMMETYYGREALIYTLGLGIEHDEARRVLDPSNYTSSNLNTWWTNYNNTPQNNTIDGYSYNKMSITRAEGAVDGDGESVSLTDYRYYVDQYFDAESSAELVAAFDKIVEAIILQSRYYPTLVEGGKYDLDGYITFEDEIGGYVEVKDIKGMLLGGELYTGAALIKAISTQGVFGNASTYTEYGNELVVSISERLNIDEARARTLLSSAWGSTDGQLRTVNGVSNNFIGWYGDEKNEYLGHWDTNHTATNYPEGAKYLNKCYIFQGDLNDTYSSLAGADMMHIVVQVHEEIATGHQCVIWKIPASLVPLITYTVSVEGNQLVDGMPATLSTNIDEVSPISLLYEVGIVDTINEVNLLTEVAKDTHVKENHQIIKDGKTIGYAFYSNRWGGGHNNDGSGVTDVFDNGNMATVSHFVPSKENERYYYTEDTIVYKLVSDNGTPYNKEDDTYEPYTGDAPTGNGYYYPYIVIGKPEGETNTSVHAHYLPIAPDVIASAKRLDDGTGRYYIEARIIHQAIDDYIIYKDDVTKDQIESGNIPAVAGKTGTMPYVDKPYINNLTNIYDFLGNNGRWMMYTATGLAITKTIEDAAVAAGTVDFEFVVELTNKNSVPQDVKVVDIDGNTISSSSSDNKITVTVKNGQTAYIVGLEAGTTYTVKENYNDNYVVSSATGEAVTGSGKNTVVSGTVEQYVVDNAEFINKHSTHKGNLVVSKTITHPYGDDYVIRVNENTVFKVNVNLAGNTDVANAEFGATGTVKYKNSENKYVTGIVKLVATDENGNVITVTLTDDKVLTNTSSVTEWWLGHDDSFTILAIPEDVRYNVEEIGTYAGFTQITPAEKLEGTIVSDETVYAELVNNYDSTDVDTSNIDVRITKNLTGTTWDKLGPSAEFTFVIDRYDLVDSATGAYNWVTVSEAGSLTASKANSTGETTAVDEFKGKDGETPRLTFTKPGVYYYRVSEVIPENAQDRIDGVEYDETHAYFRIIVTDDTMDGSLDISVEDYNNVTHKTENGKTVILAQFTNRYDSTVANVAVHKVLDNNTGMTDVKVQDFRFGMYYDEAGTQPVYVKSNKIVDAETEGAAPVVVTVNASGDVIIPIEYTEADVTNTTGKVISESVGEGERVTAYSEYYTYYIREIVPADGEKVVGIIYDTTPVEVTVTVTKTVTETKTAVVSETQQELSTVETDDQGEPVEGTEPLEDEGEGEEIQPLADATTYTYTEKSKTLSAAVSYVKGDETPSTALFTNTYRLDQTKVQVGVKVNKTLTGGRNIAKDEFTFHLYETGSSFATEGITPKKVSVGDGSEATAVTVLTLPTVTTAGTYYYVIKEELGSNAAITYDPATYHITVVVDKHTTKAELEIKTVTINKVGGSSVVYDTTQLENIAPVEFNNTYTVLQGASVTVNGDKDVTGKDILVQDEFVFGVYSDAACTAPVYVDANGYVVASDAQGATKLVAKSAAVSGAFSFTVNYAQTGTHKYYIKEEAPQASYGGTMTTDPTVYIVDVTVTDANGDGKLEAASTMHKADSSGNATGEAVTNAKFTNTFEPSIAPARTILGTKIYADSDNAAIPVEDWQGTFNFDLYQYHEDTGLMGESVLTQTVPNGKVYTGTYNEATGKFDTNVSLTEYTTNDGDSISNKQQFGLDLKFTEAGTYYYILKEVPGTDSNVHFDTAEHYVTYIVTEAADGSGTLNAAVSVVHGGNVEQNSEFRNYKIKKYVDVQVKLTKEINNISTIGIPINTFQFGLYTDKACTQPVKVNGVPLVSYASTNGDASFNFQYDNVSYTITDNIPYAVTYYAKEIIPSEKIVGMTYDESVYKVDIVVKVDTEDEDKDGDKTELIGYDEITQIVAADGTAIPNANQKIEADNEATFTNKFEIDDAKLVIDGTKTIDGRVMTSGDVFEFGLYNAVVPSGETTGWSAGELVGADFVVNNNGDAFAFPEISFNAEGTHYYVVKETVPTDTVLPNITYDTTEYLVKVVVVNGGNGSFVATESVVAKKVGSTYTAATNENPLDVAFTNVFTPTPIDVTIEGTKSYNGTLKEGQFTFELYNADGNYNETGDAIATVTNTDSDNDGQYDDIVFSGIEALKFTQAETRRFVVVEKSGNDPTVKYDTKEYNVEVKVTKDNTGTLIPAITVTNREAGETGLVIKNTYTSKTANTTVNLKKTLTNNTGVNPGVAVENFEFKLYTDENCNNPVATNDANVSVSTFNPGANGEYGINFNYADTDFNLTDYTQTKTYTYYLKETEGSVSGMDYDKSVYKIEIALKYSGTALTATPTVTKVRDAAGAEIANPTSVTTASFNNVYDLGSVKAEIRGTKSLTSTADNTDVWNSDDYKGYTFTIQLYQTGEDHIYAGLSPIATATVSNSSRGFIFKELDALEFTKAGTYHFVVKEVNGGRTITNGTTVRYDGTEYGVDVVVSKNETTGNTLKTEVKYHLAGHNTPVDGANFSNKAVIGDYKVEFGGTKNYIGSPMKIGEFIFELYNANVSAENVWTKTSETPYIVTENETVGDNAGDNNIYSETFTFGDIAYKDINQNTSFYYIAEEAPVNNPTVICDTTRYGITVSFTLNNTTYDSSVTVVELDANGNVVTNGKTSVEFNNTYKPFKTNERPNVPAVITVDKEITNTTGVDRSNDTFTFGLYTDKECTTALMRDADDFVVTSGGTAATFTATETVDGSITLYYTDKDVKTTPYVYYLKEIVPAQAAKVAGMDYSEEVYKVEVLVHFVKENGVDILKAVPTVTALNASGASSQAESAKAVITNNYALNPAKTTLSGQKILPEHAIRKDDFTFELYKAAVNPENGTVVETNGIWTKGAKVDTALNDGQIGTITNDYDLFTFDELTFDKAGTYHYIVEEAKASLRGVTYDADRYQVTVDVAPHEKEAKLVASISKIERVNYTYNDQDGRVLDTSDDTTDGLVDGKVEIVVEQGKPTVTFTNHYTAEGKFSIGGTKEITKRDWRDGDSFTFELYKATVDAQGEWTVGNKVAEDIVDYADAVKEFVFSNIEVSDSLVADTSTGKKVAQIGTHYFVLKEKDNGDTVTTAVDYDDTVYRITVNTKDNGDGTLAVGIFNAGEFTAGEYLVTKADGSNVTEITFVNEYVTDPVEVTISGKKDIDNADIKDFNGKFTFELYKADVDAQNNWTIDTTVNPVTTTNTNDTFEFADLTFDRAGTYYFIVKEQKGTNPIVKYDATEHKVVITVTDEDISGGEAQLRAKVDVLAFTSNGEEVVEFTNSYNPTDVTVNIKKALSFTNGATHTLGGFKFKVEGVGNNTSIEATSGNDGTIAVPFSYTEKDLDAANGYAPKIYTYKVTEINTGIERMTYDNSEYVIEVEVYAENGELKTAITQNGVLIGANVKETEVNFNNTYKGVEPVPDTPVDPGRIVDTSDLSNNMLYIGIMAVSAACLIAIFFIRRKKEDEEAEA